MVFPTQDYIPTSRDMQTNFQGLDAKLTSCTEGEFFDLKNITTQYYPVLSPRNKRTTSRRFTNLQALLDKESLIWIDDGRLYIDGEEKDIAVSEGLKTIAKMGAFIIIMPDGIWYNCDNDEHGTINEVAESIYNNVHLVPCKADGTQMENIHDEAYYKDNKPLSGDIMVTYDDNGKAHYKVYSELTNMWSAVTSTYIGLFVDATDLTHFKEGDGVKISIDISNLPQDEPFRKYADKLFVNKEDNGWLSITTIIKKQMGSLVITGITDTAYHISVPFKIERTMPEMAFVTECQNRLWGCSKDGHEIYCCKLGDVTNWNYFSGTSIDSYAATVGSDGVFTGAVTYNNNPIFFKEHSFLKVSVSSNGAHSYREQIDRGVQAGSSASICNVNGVLFYKGVSDVYAYDGSSPIGVGEKLGEHRYSDAICGTINGRYYMSVKTGDKRELFVFDAAKSLWAKEDNPNITYFAQHKDMLYFVADNVLWCIDGEEGEEEKPVVWSAESGYIGFNTSAKKYVSKVNIRMSLSLGSYCDMWIQYDNDPQWKHLFNMSGKGTRSFVVPVLIQRCDHFRIKLSGKGECKIYAISKTIEEGSDL